MERFSHRFRCTNVGHWWGLAWSLLSPVFRDDHVFQMLLKQWLTYVSEYISKLKGVALDQPIFCRNVRPSISFDRIHEPTAAERQNIYASMKKRRRRERSMLTAKTIITVAGWWFGTFLYFPFHMGCHPSHWRSPSFFKMVCLHHQPVSIVLNHH